MVRPAAQLFSCLLLVLLCASCGKPPDQQYVFRKRGLKRLPDNIPSPGKVTSMDISHNLLSELLNNSFARFPGLEQLDLSFNELLSLQADALLGLELLVELDLSYNKLAHLNPRTFEACSKLWKLNLRNNPLISPFIASRSLQILDVSHCGVERLNVSQMPKLQYLDLSSNSIKSLPASALASNGSLQFVDVGNNPWRCCSLPLLLAWFKKAGVTVEYSYLECTYVIHDSETFKDPPGHLCEESEEQDEQGRKNMTESEGEDQKNTEESKMQSRISVEKTEEQSEKDMKETGQNDTNMEKSERQDLKNMEESHTYFPSKFDILNGSMSSIQSELDILQEDVKHLQSRLGNTSNTLLFVLICVLTGLNVVLIGCVVYVWKNFSAEFHSIRTKISW